MIFKSALPWIIILVGAFAIAFLRANYTTCPHCRGFTAYPPGHPEQASCPCRSLPKHLSR